MKKILFLHVFGSLITANSFQIGKTYTDSDEAAWSTKWDSEAVKNLNLAMRDGDIDIVILDAPKSFTPKKVIDCFVSNGFLYPQLIKGETFRSSHIKVQTPNSPLGILPFPIFPSNLIEHYLNNVIARPYIEYPELAIKYEIWEADKNGVEPNFKGMRVLEEGKHYSYLICSSGEGLLTEHAKNLIQVDFKIGVTSLTAKNILMHSW